MRICLFTANKSGGIAQYTVKFAETLRDLGHEIYLILPIDFDYEIDNVYIEFYNKDSNVYKLADHLKTIIMKISPTMIISTDNSITSLKMTRLSKLSGVSTFLIIHDPRQHPTRFTLRTFAKRLLEKLINIKIRKHVDIFCFLSNSSLKKHKYALNKGNYYVIPLGEHLIVKHNTKSDESMISYSNYFLFFGRIDKYKGLIYLLKAYELDTNNELPILIVAGKGRLSSSEQELMNKLSHRVIHLNYFISDNIVDMLFEKCSAVILPYIEISQSGIIPIAYKHKKPVLCSNLSGFKEFVEEEVTGLLFESKNVNDLYLKLSKLQANISTLSRDDNFCNILLKIDWMNNLSSFIDNFRKNEYHE